MRTGFLTTLLAAALVPGSAQNQPALEWTPAYSMKFRDVSSVQVSPDGRFALWTQREAVIAEEKSEYRTHIFLSRADGSSRLQLTRGEKSALHPGFSADSRYIYFTSDRTGKTNLFRIAVAGGESEQLTDWKGAMSDFAISPDGANVVFAGREEEKDEEKRSRSRLDFKIVNDAPRNASLFLIATAGELPGKPRKLVDEPYHAGEPAWSPDGKRIAFVHRPRPEVNSERLADLAEVDVESGKVRELAAEPVSETAPRYSPDGAFIAFIKSAGRRRIDANRIALLTRSSGAVRLLEATPDDNPALIGWMPDSRALLFTELRGTRSAIFRMPVDGPPVLLRKDDRGLTGAAHLNQKGTHLGFTRESPDEPREAYVWNMKGDPVRVSEANHQIARPPLGRTELIRWKSSDGREVEGLLTYPASYTAGQKAPLILNIHGGPASAFLESFIGAPGLYPVASFAHKGYAVLRPNPRGSSGYGAAARQIVVQDWGGHDFEDLQSGVDHVIEMGVADPNRLAVMGWSYGGYMTAWTITQTTRFKAAAVGAGITNHVSMYGTQDIPSTYEDYFGGPPWSARGVYMKSSPIEFAGRVKTPTLILHGEKDDRVPITQAYEFHRALERQGVPVRMIAYPRTPHGPSEPKFLQHIAEQHLEWADRYLK